MLNPDAGKRKRCRLGINLALNLEVFKVNKCETFLGLADYITRKFGFLPLLYGSLGLGKRLNMDLCVDDIDILIPEKYLFSMWNCFKQYIEEFGFILTDLHEHEFTKDGVRIAFASIESLESYADIDISQIPVVDEKSCRYLLLDLDDYLKVYKASSKDSYRLNKNNQKDLIKIDVIRKSLGYK